MKLHSENYVHQLSDMRQRLVAWVKANPEKEVKIQFNFPNKIAVIATIRVAMNEGFVSVNDAGRELIESMCDRGLNEPTVLMVRAVLEH